MNKIKGLLVSMLAVALCVLIALGSFSMMALAGNNRSGAFDSTSTEFFSDFANAQRRVRLTDRFDVPVPNDDVSLTVTAPNGLVIIDTNRTPVILSIDGTAQARGPASGDVVYEVYARQVGNYTVRFVCDEEPDYNVFEYLVNSFEDREHTIQVEETLDAFMPAFRRASRTGETAMPILDNLRLPRFFLSYTNERGEINERENVTYEVRFTPGNASIRTLGEGTPPIGSTAMESARRYGRHEIAAGQNGNLELHDLRAGVLNITFIARLNDSNSRYYTREFSINVQNHFGIDSATASAVAPTVTLSPPTLSVINMPNTHNINTRLTIPTATASDAFVNNVFIETTVTDPNGNAVRKYQLNEHGFARRDANGDPIYYQDGNGDPVYVVFNNRSPNADHRSFVPTVYGTYTIILRAYNGGGRFSQAHTYQVRVQDRLAPRIVDIDEYQIPSNWGRRRINDMDANWANGTHNFTIPFPEVVDNADDLSDLDVTITIMNPNNRTVARWVGPIVTRYEDGNRVVGFDEGVEMNTVYRSFFNMAGSDPLVTTQDLVFTDEGLLFNFNMFHWDQARLQADIERNGNWSIIYSVRDSAGNGGSGTARRQLTMSVEETLTNRERPMVGVAGFENALPDYVLIIEGRETFTVPSIAASSDRMTRLRQTYTMRANVEAGFTPGGTQSDADGRYIMDGGIRFDVVGYTEPFDVRGGEVFRVRTMYVSGNNYYFLTIVRGHEAFAIPLVVGTDHLASIILEFEVEDALGNYWRQRNEADTAWERVLRAEVPFLFAGGIVQDLELISLIGTETDLDDAQMQGREWNLGGFDIEGVEWEDYTGFEISLRDPNGAFVNTTSYSFFYDGVLSVRNITASPTVVVGEYGIYSLLIRAFDVSGISQVRAYTFKVYRAPRGYTGTGGGRAPSISSITTGQVNTAYRLEDNYIIAGHIENPLVVRRIVGPSFALAGHEFTALSVGGFQIESHLIEKGEYDDNTNLYDLWNVGDNLPVFDFASRLRRYNVIEIVKSGTPVIEVDGIMPSYMRHARPLDDETGRGGRMPYDPNVFFPGEFIHLPIFVGHTEFQNARMTVNVSFGPDQLTARQLYRRVLSNDDRSVMYMHFSGGETHTNENRNTFTANTTPSAFPYFTFDDVTTVEISGDEVEVENIPTGMWVFATDRDGYHTVSVHAQAETGSNTRTFDIRIGRTSNPAVRLNTVTLQRSAAIGEAFVHPDLIDEGGNEDWDEITITITNPDGSAIAGGTNANARFSYSTWNMSGRDPVTNFEFDRAGIFIVTVVITATGSDNVTTEVFHIEVAGDPIDTTSGWLALTIVLIIIGVALILGAIVYAVRFKPKRVENKQSQGI